MKVIFMKKSIHSWAFLLSILCIVLFIIATSSESIVNTVTLHLTIHPLTIVLILTIASFFLNMIGMKEIKNKASLLKSFTGITLTIGLSLVILVILGVGNLFS